MAFHMFNLMGFALNPFYRQGGRFRAFLMCLLLGVGEPVPSGLSKVPPWEEAGYLHRGTQHTKSNNRLLREAVFFTAFWGFKR